MVYQWVSRIRERIDAMLAYVKVMRDQLRTDECYRDIVCSGPTYEVVIIK